MYSMSSILYGSGFVSHVRIPSSFIFLSRLSAHGMAWQTSASCLLSTRDIRTCRETRWNNSSLGCIKKLPEGPYKRGYKAPADITQKHVLKQLGDYFPKTGLIVGIRHPVWWFQIYNFRTQGFGRTPKLPHPTS
jgi:hypothetical protein